MSPVHSYYLVSDFQVFPFLLKYLKILFNILKWCVQKRPSINSITIYLSPSKLKKKKKKKREVFLDYFSLLHNTPLYQVLLGLKYSSNPMTYLSSSSHAIVLATVIVSWTTEVISNSFPYFYSCLPQFIFHLAATWIIKKKE